MVILGIETSCDECGCGIVNEKLEVLANELFIQDALHSQYGGVVPEIAARAHLEKIDPVLESCLFRAGLKPADIDRIAFTRGPGLVGPLMVGASFALGLSKNWGTPLMGINHLEGHIAASFLGKTPIRYPFICLTVSGGHTELCLLKSDFRVELVGKTRDDAAGEAFDKCGKMLGLAYPAGARLSQLAERGNRQDLNFPHGMDEKGNFEFSFSGLKTAVWLYLSKMEKKEIYGQLPSIAASIESAIIEILVKKTIAAAERWSVSQIVVCGGVSANNHLRKRMPEEAIKKNIDCSFPPLEFCTDNGAMIAAAAQLKHLKGDQRQYLSVSPSLSWNDRDR